MTKAAKATGDAYDASVVVVDGDPERTLERAQGAVSGFNIQLTDIDTSIEGAERKVAKAAAALEAAKESLAAHEAERAPIEAARDEAVAFLETLKEGE